MLVSTPTGDRLARFGAAHQASRSENGVLVPASCPPAAAARPRLPAPPTPTSSGKARTPHRGARPRTRPSAAPTRARKPHPPPCPYGDGPPYYGLVPADRAVLQWTAGNRRRALPTWRRIWRGRPCMHGPRKGFERVPAARARTMMQRQSAVRTSRKSSTIRPWMSPARIRAKTALTFTSLSVATVAFHLASGGEVERLLQVEPRPDDRAAYGEPLQHRVEDGERERARRQADERHRSAAGGPSRRPARRPSVKRRSRARPARRRVPPSRSMRRDRYCAPFTPSEAPSSFARARASRRRRPPRSPSGPWPCVLRQWPSPPMPEMTTQSPGLVSVVLRPL